MPAAVSDRPPRKGPINRYFIPLKIFSSGLEDSAASVPLSVEGAACAAGCEVCAAGDGFTAFDCRSGLACECAPLVKELANATAKNNRANRDACLQKLSEPMFKVSPGKK